MPASPESVAWAGLASRLLGLRDSRLIKQNAVLFAGGLVAGVASFVYHAIAARVLGPARYGEVASLVALYTVGTTANLILVLVLARAAATFRVQDQPGAIRRLTLRTATLLAPPAVAFCLLALFLAGPAAAFLNLRSAVPLVWLAIAIVSFLYVAVPRGVLQGTQRFAALSANLGLEVVVRTGTLALLLAVGFAVTGSVVAIVLGCLFAFGLGMACLGDLLRVPAAPARLRGLAGFAATATAGTLGVILLFNLDVVLAKHYLDPHDAGIYGGLNRVGTIVYYLTVSVGQVLFPRVVEAVTSGRHPGRLLALSTCLIGALGLGAVVVFGTLPSLVVGVLFGPAFREAVPYVLAFGFIGLAISLCNLLVQFLMAVPDRLFIPVLAAGCALMPALIALHHGGLTQVVTDVAVSVFVLLAALGLRCLLLVRRLRPKPA